MKKKNNQNNFFEVKCACDGNTILSLSIPYRLYGDFENCFKTVEGMKVLTTLQEEYSALSDLHKDTYQMLVFEYADDIIDVKDLISLMRAMKKVVPEE